MNGYGFVAASILLPKIKDKNIVPTFRRKALTDMVWMVNDFDGIILKPNSQVMINRVKNGDKKTSHTP